MPQPWVLMWSACGAHAVALCLSVCMYVRVLAPQRLDPSYDNPHPWNAPDLPALLSGPVPEDELSDDSESDEEDDLTTKPTWEMAMKLFVPSEEGKGEEGKGEESKGDAAEAKVAAVEDAAASTAEIPRDRARLSLAALERRRQEAAAAWLANRLRQVDAHIRSPLNKFAFDAVPRVHW